MPTAKVPSSGFQNGFESHSLLVTMRTLYAGVLPMLDNASSGTTAEQKI